MSFEFYNGGQMPDATDLISVKIKAKSPHIDSIEKLHTKSGNLVAIQTLYTEGDELIEFFQKNGSQISLYTDAKNNLQIQYSYDENGDLLERVDAYKGQIYTHHRAQLGAV